MFELPEPPFEKEPRVGCHTRCFDDCSADLDTWPVPDEFEDDGEYARLPDPIVERAAEEALAELERAHDPSQLDELDANATLAEAAGVKRAERAVQARLLSVRSALCRRGC
jgi:hypothetical protein